MKEGFFDRPWKKIADLFKFSRMDLVVPPFIFAGLAQRLSVHWDQWP
jgi:hypothetical protein